MRLEVGERLSALEAAERRAVLSESSRHWALLHVNEEIVDRARGRFPHEPIPSLDALHLASALMAGRTAVGVGLLSLDEGVRRAGRALGFKLLPA